jgi:hypothetical protein
VNEGRALPSEPRKVVNAKLLKGSFSCRSRGMTARNNAIGVNFPDRINRSLVFCPHYAAPVELAVGRME